MIEVTGEVSEEYQQLNLFKYHFVFLLPSLIHNLHNILKFIPYPLILYRNRKSYTVDIAEKENCKVTPEEIKEQLDVITVQVD